MGGGLESGTQNGRALSGWPERVLLGVGLVLVAAGLSWAAFAPPAAPRPGGGVEPAERPAPGAVTPTALPQVGARPADPLALEVLVRGYVLRGNYDAALELYGGAREDADAAVAVARIQLARGDLDLAEAAIQRALALRDDSPAAWIELGRLVLARRRDEQEALGLFRKALELDRAGGGAAAYTAIGRLHLRAGRLAEAEEAFRGALALDQTDVAARDDLARVLLVRGDLDGADRELRRALAPDVNQPRALATLAEVSSRRGDGVSALVLVRRALELAPASVEAHTAAGRIYQREGQLSLAERHYREAAEWSHFCAEPHLELARLHLEQGADEQAMEAFRAALEEEPENRSAMVSLGRDHLRAGRVEAAFRLYRRTLEIDPDYARGHGGVGTIYLLRGRPELAVHHLRKSLELAPEQDGAQELRDKLAAAEESLAARVGEQTAASDTGSDGE